MQKNEKTKNAKRKTKQKNKKMVTELLLFILLWLWLILRDQTCQMHRFDYACSHSPCLCVRHPCSYGCAMLYAFATIIASCACINYFYHRNANVSLAIAVIGLLVSVGIAIVALYNNNDHWCCFLEDKPEKTQQKRTPDIESQTLSNKNNQTKQKQQMKKDKRKKSNASADNSDENTEAKKLIDKK